MIMIDIYGKLPFKNMGLWGSKPYSMKNHSVITFENVSKNRMQRIFIEEKKLNR